MQKPMITKKIAIVGCGPVGMFGSLLFEHFNIDYVTVEKHPSIRAHPSAHWINPSTKTLFGQIPNLVQQLDKHQQQQKWEYYSCFRYVQTIFGYQFGITQHFQPSVQQKLKQCQLLFGYRPSHIPQNKMLKIMYNLLNHKQNILFNQQITRILPSHSQQTNKNEYILANQNGQKIIKAQYVILCNGASSKLRDNLPAQIIPFKMQGEANLMNFINIHFSCDRLAQKIRQTKSHAMLHFIYNKKINGILINHAVAKSGEFVLQLVNYQPIVDLLQIYQPKQLISMIFQENNQAWQIINDLTIINVSKWDLSAQIADRFYSSGIFLAGDSAHSIPPAGQFGMNIGLHDIHQLVHCFILLQNNVKADKFKVFCRFNANRWEINYKYLKKALQNYEITKKTAKKLGLSSSPVQIFSNSSILKSLVSTISQKKPHYMQKIRLKALNMVFKRVEFDRQPLQLFCDQFDISTQKISIVKNKILQKNSIFKNKTNANTSAFSKSSQAVQTKQKFYTLFARQWSVTMEQITQIFGQIKSANIKFFNDDQPQYKHGQRLILSDGTILIP